MKDQKSLWNKLHVKGNIRKHSQTETSFAQEVCKLLSPNSKILELGAGAGNDSAYFSNLGYLVTAADFSEVVINENAKNYRDQKLLSFKVLDMSIVPYEFTNEEFDLVYARLSLHYFPNKATQQIVAEIYRILKPSGYFCFMCKSVNDPLYGKGEKIENDMFEENGHVRHFFSEEYSKELLKNKFEVIKIESGEDELYGKKSGFVKVIAIKV